MATTVSNCSLMRVQLQAAEASEILNPFGQCQMNVQCSDLFKLLHLLE